MVFVTHQRQADHLLSEGKVTKKRIRDGENGGKDFVFAFVKKVFVSFKECKRERLGC